MTAGSDDRVRPRAVLITGVYGSGKTTVVEDLATLLEEAGIAYAAIDLDWLSWYDAGVDGDDGWDMLLANLAAVVGNYRSAGVNPIRHGRLLRERRRGAATRNRDEDAGGDGRSRWCRWRWWSGD